MSTGNQHQERLHEELDAAIEENAPRGKLEDAEIQRLVQLSKDASYQRSERVPVKTVEAFEPRSLVSIAMAAQRRRESELQTAMAAGAVIDEELADPSEASGDDAMAAGEDAVAGDDQTSMDETGLPEPSADAATDVIDNDPAPEGGVTEDAPSSTSQVDFEAGRVEGLEEGRRVGFDEGQAKGMEEGRAAGRAEASAQLERAVQAFEVATARLSELTAVDSDMLAAYINQAILRLASERAGLAIADQPDSFADRIEALLATIRTVSEQPTIRLNPADLASIQPLADTREKLRHCNFVADDSLAHGDLSVMVGTIGIDDIIVASATSAENMTVDPHDAAATASDDQVEDSVIKADAETGEANEVTEAAAVPQANAAQSRDGDQDG